MTRKTTIFISSTCYDLKSVRQKLKNMIEEDMGMDAKLSEHSNFPVDPVLGTVENCLKVVENNADIFVLIIGSRYGYVTDKGKSVTNLEYLRAKEKNIPIYVFIDKDTLEHYSKWKDNKKYNFPHIDNNKIFDFIQEVREEDNVWTFEYVIDTDILEELKLQLNYLFTDSLLSRKKIISSKVSKKVLSTSPQAVRLVLEKPLAWEYKFFFQTLKDELKKHEEIKKDFEYEILIEKGKFIKNIIDIPELVTHSLRRFEYLIIGLNNLINEALPKALGQPGEPSDLDFLVYIAERFSSIYLEIIKWKLELKNIYAPKEANNLLETLHVISDSSIEDIDDFIDNCINAFDSLPDEIADGETHTLELTLKLKGFDTTPLENEIQKLNKVLSL